MKHHKGSSALKESHFMPPARSEALINTDSTHPQTNPSHWLLYALCWQQLAVLDKRESEHLHPSEDQGRAKCHLGQQ